MRAWAGAGRSARVRTSALALSVLAMLAGAAAAPGTVATRGEVEHLDAPLVASDVPSPPEETAPRPRPARERGPVLLVPGWSDEADQLEPLRARFVAAGWPDSAVVALSFDDPVGGNRSHARDVGRAVARLQMSAGVERVDVVAHSMGGLAVRYYLQSGGADDVRRVVFLATPHRGTYAAYVAWGAGGREMAPGSDFLLSLNRRLFPLPEGVEGITVRTPVDLHILPPESAALPPLPDIEVCCPTHAGLVDHEETFRVIESFLTRQP